MGDGVSMGLCRMAAGLLYENLSQGVVDAAFNVLVDAVGTMLAASAFSPDVRPFVELAGAGGGGPCDILGSKLTAPPAMAALANGALSHALDFEDTHDPTAGHPNASLVPALIALAQSEPDIAGSDFIAALVAGCEVSCRMAQTLLRPLEEGGWYPPPILAGIGATVGAARLLRLDEEQMLYAVSLALCQLTMPGQIKHEPASTIRSIREAFPAQAAVQAALLARSGVTGFREPLEGKGGFFALFAGSAFDASVLQRPFRSPFAIEELTFKPWPSCRGTHAGIQLSLGYLEAGGDLRRATRIVIEHDAVQAMLIDPIAEKRAPSNVIGAKFSIPFCTALALQTGWVDLESFPKMLNDASVLAVASKVEGREVEVAERGRGVGGAIEIWADRDLLYHAEVAEPAGSPRQPLPRKEIEGKCMECMRLRREVSQGELEKALGILRNIPTSSNAGHQFAMINSILTA